MCAHMAAGAVLLLQQHRQPLCKPQPGLRVLLRGAPGLLPGARGPLPWQGELLLHSGGRVQHGRGLHSLRGCSGVMDAQVRAEAWYKSHVSVEQGQHCFIAVVMCRMVVAFIVCSAHALWMHR